MTTNDALIGLMAAAVCDPITAQICFAAGACGWWMPAGPSEVFRIAFECATETGKSAIHVYGTDSLTALSEVDQDRVVSALRPNDPRPPRTVVCEIFAQIQREELVDRMGRCATAEQLRTLCAEGAKGLTDTGLVFTGAGGSPRALAGAAFTDRPKRLLEGKFPPAIAPLIEGAITPDSATVIIAPAKLGKTSVLTDIAEIAARADYRVKYFTLGDDGAEAITRRMLRAYARKPLKGDWGCNRIRTVGYHICDRAAKGECFDCPGNCCLDPYPTEKLFKKAESFRGVIESYGEIPVCPKCGTCELYAPRPWWKFEKPPPALDLADFDMMPKWMDNIDIRYAKKGRCSIADITRAMDEFDIGIVDYADMLRFGSEREADHEQFREVWEEFRNMAHETKKAMVTASQVNRAGAGAQSQSVQTMGRTKAVGDNATAVIALNQTSREKTRRTARMQTVLAREYDFSPELQAEICIDPTTGVWLQGPSRPVFMYDDEGGIK